MLILAWHYLTGRCVATDFADREKAEWPPHPDRVFQALVAAWGERGEDPEERRALEWLEAQPFPQLSMPSPDDAPEPVKVYVPVNDVETRQKTYGDPLLAILPAHRSRKERYFPHTRVGDSTCALLWPTSDAGDHLPVLARLCAEVSRIGHSSSMVRCWVGQDPLPATHAPSPQARRKDCMLRVPAPGRLAALCASHQQGVSEGKYNPPPLAQQISYIPIHGASEPIRGLFGAPLLIFRQVGGNRFSLKQAPDVVNAFRQTLIKCSEAVSPEAKALVSGHAPDGTPLQTVHLAYLPLAFVGHAHADGHLLGMALAFPQGIAPEAEERAFQGLARAMDEREEIHLVLGVKGEMVLRVEDRPEAPWALRSATWCQPSRTWATVTPIVMDRMQNARRSDPDGWAAEQIAQMCEKQGLPRPSAIVLRPVSMLTGTPTQREFPPLVRKDGRSHRQVHAHLTFPVEVAGPLLLGAGRYKGYGLCKPCKPVENSPC